MNSPCSRRKFPLSRLAWLLYAGLVLNGRWGTGADVPGILADEKPAAAKADQSPDFEETWQVVYMGKARVGFGRSSTARVKREGEERVVNDTDMTMVISRFGQSIKTKIVARTEETTAGELVDFEMELQNPPAAASRSSGRVTEDRLVLKTETNGKTATRELPWDKSIKSSTYQDRELRENPLKPGEKRTYKTFDPQFAKVTTVTLQAGALRDVALLDGKTKKLLEVTVTQSIAPLIVTQEYVDEKGIVLKSTVSALAMATYTVSKAEALKDLTGEEVDLAVNTLVRTGEIKKARQTSQVVYRITTPGEDPEKIVSTGATQQARRVGPNTIDLTVVAISPPESAPAGDGNGPGKEFLSANSYLQSDDELVRKHAADAVADETDSWKAAELMEHWVWENLKKKNFSTLLASAAEVAKDLSGDCTEHAVLLAAMCRAREIPSRVAVGLVYVPELSSFGGHMWTEVYVNGKWVPLDATFGKGGIAADHIKFADSSFSDEGDAAPLAEFLPMVSVLSKLKIEIREVKHGP